MSEGRFFTFPLSLLYPSEDYKSTLQRIVCYCVVTVGSKSAESLDEEVAEQIIERKHKPRDFRDCQRHREIILGAERLNVTLPNIGTVIKCADEARKLIETIEAQCGTSPLVFVGAPLFWGCHDKHSPTYRDFTVLCAVNSVIGLKRQTPVLIRRELICARAAGCKTRAAYERVTHPRFQRRPLLTISQLKTTLENLEKAGMFVRIIGSPRMTYFSKADRETARKQVAEIVAKRSAQKVTQWRELDRLAMKEARERAANGPENAS